MIPDPPVPRPLARRNRIVIRPSPLNRNNTTVLTGGFYPHLVSSSCPMSFYDGKSFDDSTTSSFCSTCHSNRVPGFKCEYENPHDKEKWNELVLELSLAQRARKPRFTNCLPPCSVCLCLSHLRLNPCMVPKCSQLISPFPPLAPLVVPIRFGARLSSCVCFLHTHSATTLAMIGWNLWRPRVLRLNLDTRHR